MTKDSRARDLRTAQNVGEPDNAKNTTVCSCAMLSYKSAVSRVGSTLVTNLRHRLLLAPQSAVVSTFVRRATTADGGNATLIDVDLAKIARILPNVTGGSSRAVAFATVGSGEVRVSPSGMQMKKNSDKADSNNSNSEKGTEKEKRPEKEKTPPKGDKTPKKKDTSVTKDESLGSSVEAHTGGVATGSGGSGNNNENDGNNNNNNGDKDDAAVLSIVADEETGSYPPLLAIAMKDRPPLPGTGFSINVTDSNVIRSIDEMFARREAYFVMFHMKNADDPDTDVIHDKDSVHEIGLLCFIQRFLKDDDSIRIFGYPLVRCKIQKLTAPGDAEEDLDNDSPTAYLRDFQVSHARVKQVKDEPYDINSPELRNLIEDCKGQFAQFAQLSPSKKSTIENASKLFNSPEKLADYIGSAVAAHSSAIQELLEESNVEKRLRKALKLLKIEIAAFKISDSTIKEMTEKSESMQIKQTMREYIKGLQRNAGLVDLETSKLEKYDKRLEHLTLTKDALEAYELEKARLNSQSEHSSELSVSERYLDWLTSIPWGVFSRDRFDIKFAKEVLNREHYGLKEVKERILEFISMGKVSGKVNGKILCLVGPPGTGKTSIAQSIAEAINRKYIRIAMGGIHDVHEVKGHRRTYIGSVPGRIISGLKKAKTSNPLMLIDEIDKLDLSKSGGAASAFLEILDPEQNHSFVDNYIDVSVDLSKVLFVCTANYLGAIPEPLRDRMEIIEVSGYTSNEKVEIAKTHIIPQAAKKAGLDETHVIIPTESITKLVDKYCRESGLRNVKRLVTRIFSKASLKIAEQLEEMELKSEIGSLKADSNNEHVLAKTDSSGEESSESAENTQTSSGATEDWDTKPVEIPEDLKLVISPDVLKDYIGPEIFTKTRVYEVLPPGVATGLAYNSSGNGDALYIESILTHSIESGSGHAGMHVTGHLKDVMKESASIAYSYAMLLMVKEFPENRFFEAADIHIHCPDGAIPKDGPSAGISFTSSLLSLALNEPLQSNIAMTGEITLTGKVLAVGGLREKILGAKRYGCDTVIIPKDIEYELEDILEEIKDGVKFIPVLWYSEVLDVLFPNADKKKFNDVWKAEFQKLDDKKKKKT